MTPLEALIRSEIETQGPMRMDRYMDLCLTHPEHGYYTTGTPFGAAGDFITAPEIHQMFGELVGVWLIHMWQEIGQPDDFELIELGPGRGTLMADVMRVAQAVPAFHSAAKINLLETSSQLRKLQKASLQNFDVTWVDQISDLSDRPTLLIANEFFDALPVRQFQKIGDVWLERLVKLKNGDLSVGLGKTTETVFPVPASDGAIFERSTAREVVLAQIADEIASNDGAALIFDYGDVGGLGDTLQAVADHSPVPILERSGEVDLTSHVDFAALGRQIGDCAGHLTTQGQFLKSIGIDARADALGQGKSASEQEETARAVQRLTGETAMGTLFKAMALTRNGRPTPPGF